MVTELSTENREAKGPGIDFIGESFVYMQSANALVQKYQPDSGGDLDQHSFADDYYIEQSRHPWYNEIMPWGSGNWLPQTIIKIVSDHAYLPSLLNVKTILNIAQGLMTYREEVQDNKTVKIPVIDPDIQDWLHDIRYKKYLRAAAVDVSHWAGCVSQIITNGPRSEVREIKRLDATNCRISQNRQSIFAYETWQDILTHVNYQSLPTYIHRNNRQRNFAVFANNVYPGSTYYPVNPSWGALNWIRLANEIPIYKLAAIKNGLTLKYHIRIPVDYFIITYPEGQTYDKNGAQIKDINKFRKQKELELYSNLNAYLVGNRNANKTFKSRTWIDPATNREIKGLEIEAIEDKFKYDAFLEDLEASDTRIISSQNFFPSIAGIKTINKLGGGGSETRNDYNIAAQVLTTQPQELILEALEIAKDITFPNKKDIQLGFRSVELSTTDLVKSGFITQDLK